MRTLPLAVLCTLATACTATPDDEVVFGVGAPLQTVYGTNARQGAELAVRHINESDGVAGRPLRLVFRDDHADESTAIAVAQEFVEMRSDSGIVAIIGHVNSSTTIKAAGVYERAGIPAVATSATSPAVSGLGDWIFRVASSDSSNAVELARVAAARGRRIGVLYMNDDYGRDLTRAFSAALAAAGVQVVGADPYLEELSDFTPYLERMRRKGVDLVFIAGIEGGASRIISQAHAIELDARFLGGDGVEALTGMGDAYEGTLVGVLFHPDASPQAREFAVAYREEYGREPDSSAALAYDAVQLVARAVAAGNRSPAMIREWLAGVGRDGGPPAYQGVTGKIEFDENGDPVKKRFTVGAVRDGRIVLEGGE